MRVIENSYIKLCMKTIYVYYIKNKQIDKIDVKECKSFLTI